MNIELDAEGTPVPPKEIKEMISVSREGGKTKVRINSSSVSLIQSCPRKTYYLLHRGLQSKGENPATLHGSAIHKALELFYLGSRIDRKIPSNFKRELDVMLHGRSDQEDNNLILKACRAYLDVAAPLASLDDHDKRSNRAGLWTLGHYFTTYIDDPYVVLEDKDGPLVERRLNFPLYSDDELEIEYFGTVDVVLKNPETGNILVCDHKTSSVVGNQFYKRLKPNHQYTGYIMAARKALDLDTDKFLVNCLEVKPFPKTARAAPPRFPRQVTTRTEEDFVEFTEVVVDSVVRYLGYLERENWPLGPIEACTMYAGCGFLDVCGSPSVIRENILSAKYHEPEATCQN